ncbi:uncharacterized protein LOC144381148 [Halichoerus grypus]
MTVRMERNYGIHEMKPYGKIPAADPGVVVNFSIKMKDLYLSWNDSAKPDGSESSGSSHWVKRRTRSCSVLPLLLVMDHLRGTTQGLHRTQFLILEEVYAWGAPSQHDERSPLPSSTGFRIGTRIYTIGSLVLSPLNFTSLHRYFEDGRSRDNSTSKIMSEEELHWLIIAGMKGTLTLSTKRLAAFNAAHYPEGRRLLERGRICRRLLPGQPARKGFIGPVQTWPNSSGSEGNSWGWRVETEYIKILLAPGLKSSRASGHLCFRAPLLNGAPPLASSAATEDPPGKFCCGRKPPPTEHKLPEACLADST